MSFWQRFGPPSVRTPDWRKPIVQNILQKMIAASRDVELAGGTRTKFTVSEAGRQALFDYGKDRCAVNPRFDKFVLGIPVEVDPEQAEEFIIQ